MTGSDCGAALDRDREYLANSDHVAGNLVVALQGRQTDSIALRDSRQRFPAADHVANGPLPDGRRVHRDVASRRRVRAEVVHDAVMNRAREVLLETRIV